MTPAAATVEAYQRKSKLVITPKRRVELFQKPTPAYRANFILGFAKATYGKRQGRKNEIMCRF